jgi:photoactive yellow protein
MLCAYHDADRIREAVLTTILDATFEMVTWAELQSMTSHVLDSLPFGVVGIDADGIATVYNATEARMAGLDPKRVIGTSFFDAVAQCMNNFMVAQRFEDEPDLDAIVPYVLTLRMRPTPVRLRLLSSRVGSLRFVLIER